MTDEQNKRAARVAEEVMKVVGAYAWIMDPEGIGGFKLRDTQAATAVIAREFEALEAENARLREALFNATALIGHSVSMDTTVMVAGELLTANGVWHQGRAALGASHDADA